jgi:DNA-nicking Smr family endonuclease
VKPPRGLSADEAAAWARLAATVRPLKSPLPLAGSRRRSEGTAVGGGPVEDGAKPVDSPTPNPSRKREGDRKAAQPAYRPAVGPPPPLGEDRTLDSTWDRKLTRGTLEPDFTLDLHGHTLDGAHARLDQGLTQAKAMGARVVLLITGRPRPAEAADRGERRGAIRAKVLDWLAAGPHESDIAAFRTAHRRHGGDGALYLVLRRRR